MFEIERKFLVTTSLSNILKTANAIRRLDITQIYLSDTGSWTQRVRKVVDHNEGTTYHVFTMKKKINDLRCIEKEPRVSEKFYLDLAEVGSQPLLKTRYDILVKDVRWHVDVFLDAEFDGLIVAEIELSHEDDKFSKPKWLGREVTMKKRYKNFRMAQFLNETRR